MPDCYSWCNIDLAQGFRGNGDNDSDRLDAAKDDFRDSLTSDGRRAPEVMVCSLEAGKVVNGTGIPSSSSSTSTSSPTSGGDAKSAPETMGSGADVSMREDTGSAKVAGLGVGFLARCV